MSWKKIIKAPTRNYMDRFYSGKRKDSEMADSLMARIVRDLGLPEKDEDGDEIEYYEYYDNFELDISAKIYDDSIELTVLPKGEIEIFDGDKSVHTFTSPMIQIDGDVNLTLDEPMPLDFEFEDYHNGRLYLGITESDF